MSHRSECTFDDFWVPVWENLRCYVMLLMLQYFLWILETPPRVKISWLSKLMWLGVLREEVSYKVHHLGVPSPRYPRPPHRWAKSVVLSPKPHATGYCLDYLSHLSVVIKPCTPNQTPDSLTPPLRSPQHGIAKSVANVQQPLYNSLSRAQRHYVW